MQLHKHFLCVFKVFYPADKHCVCVYVGACARARVCVRVCV